ncbi:MAG: SIS domain-containing protein, partial [Clostridia bacterium]|nr:SIS domain-containing protein [Clostridia bacterium]
MNDGEIACIKAGGALFFDASGRSVHKHAEELELEAKEIEKAGYAHFMLKEIHEQPQAVRRTIAPYIKETSDGLRVDLGAAGIGEDMLARADRVHFIGCGSAYHVGCVGRMVTERLARIPCEAELASEMRYGEPVFTPAALAVIISQSGETADSLAALRLCKAHGVRTLAIVNVPESAMAREADAVLCTQAGPEISVATTKAYAAQLAALYLLAIALASSRGAIAKAREKQLAKALIALPERIAEALSCDGEVKALAGLIAGKRDVFFIGRGLDHAACLEGSLKLKEISYIHSEAYAAGELKH